MNPQDPEVSTDSSNLPDKSHHGEVEGSSEISPPVVPDKTNLGEVKISSAEISPDHQIDNNIPGSETPSPVSGGKRKMSEYSNIEERNRVQIPYLENSKIMLVSFTIAGALLSMSYTWNGNGLAVRPEYLFRQHHVSFRLVLLSNMISFYMAAISVGFQRAALPMVSGSLNMIAYTGLILSFTVIMWDLLPDSFSCLPWLFFSLTLVVMFGSACDAMILARQDRS